MKKRMIIVVNALTFIAMLIHVAAAYSVHSAHPEWSAPASIAWLYAVFYLIPLVIFNLICLLIGRLHAKKRGNSGT